MKEVSRAALFFPFFKLSAHTFEYIISPLHVQYNCTFSCVCLCHVALKLIVCDAILLIFTCIWAKVLYITLHVKLQ